jgi:hypothetical protein
MDIKRALPRPPLQSVVRSFSRETRGTGKRRVDLARRGTASSDPQYSPG